MASIQHADSIIADSTISPSSPSRAIHENLDNDTSDLLDLDREPQIKPKRVTRTYGRSKPKEDIEVVAEGDLGFRARILRTAPLDADDQVIPESDDTTPKFRFAWEDKLKAIDEGLDISGNEGITDQHEASASVVADDQCDASDTRTELSETNEAKDELLRSIVSGDQMPQECLFNRSLSTLLSEPAPSSSQSLENDGTVAALFQTKVIHKHVIDSPGKSDSEELSPQHPYAINTPKRRSSSSPPTSPMVELALQDNVAQSGSNTKAAKKGNSSKGKGKERRTKGLTKKDVLEMQKESARLLADRPVSLERTHARSTHTIASLFNKLKPLPTLSRLDSDPIVPFSSPGGMLRESSYSPSDLRSTSKSTRIFPSATSSKTTSGTIPSKKISHNRDELGKRILYEEAGGDMPDAEDLLREHTEKQSKTELEENKRAGEKKRGIELEEQKRKALEAVQRARAGEKVSGGSDTDDDLEVEIMVSSSREDETKNPEVCSGVQATFTITGDEIRMPSRRNRIFHKDLREAARPAFLSKKGLSRQRGKNVFFSQKELNDLLLQRADRQGGAIEEKKKEQWVKSGGVLKVHHRPENEEKLVTDWLEKGAARESAIRREEEEDGDDQEYDSDYIEGHEGEESDIEGRERRSPDNKNPFHQPMDTSDEDFDADKENHRPLLRRHTARAIVGSDDEDQPMTLSHTVLVPDTSYGEHSDDSSGGDKENSAELAFSVDENKENKEVPRHSERGRVLDAAESPNSEFMPALSVISHVAGSSKPSREPLSRLDADTELGFVPEAVTRRRDDSPDRVLQVLHEEDKDATVVPIGSMNEGLPRRSSSPSEYENLDEPTLVSPIGFSQLFGGDRSEGPVPGPILGVGRFSQFFSPSGDKGDSPFATPLKGNKPPSQPQYRSAQSKADNFEFTQPNALLPSIKISESQRREVDEMFSKDQEFKLDEAKRSKIPRQDAASSASDTLHLSSFIPSPIAQTPGSIRKPLETLSLGSRSKDALLDESPQSRPPRRSRLLRGPRERSSSSPSPPLVLRNAFDVLRDGASKSKHRERGAKQEIGKSEYIEVEAEESDEEAMLGFGGAKGIDDDEEGNEDPNMVVENLVDDTILDDAAQAADLVLQKHLEHQAVDDAALEKLHQDAVDGKLRGKRRDREIGVLDSDSEESDVGGSRKQPLYKKRRVDGDNLEACGNDPTTAPFYNAYQAALTDEYLNIGHDDTPSPQEKVTQDASDDEGSDSQVVDPIKIRRQIIDENSNQRLRSSSPELDPENASWVDSDDQDMADIGDIRVENGPLHPRKATTSTDSRLDHVGYRGLFEGKKTGASEERQLKTWASQESRATTFATGRGGFSRKDAVNGSSTRKQGKLAPMKDPARNEGKVIVKHSSLMSHVEKRKGFNG